jgi:hypothetical protein
MQKKSDVIARLMQEKGVSEEACEEHFAFKSQEWVDKRESGKRGGAASKHTKNLKQIMGNDPYSE